MNKRDKYHKSHTPVIIGNYAPFRLVLRQNDKWNPTLKDINDKTYDYVKLSRLSCFIDIGIPPFSLGVSYDGSLILPATEKFQNREQALLKFNETLGLLLLGGVYSEAVQPNDISYGTLFINGYVKHYGGGIGKEATFHHSIKTKHVGTIESIGLLDPPTIGIVEFIEGYKKGATFSKFLRNLSPSLYLNGTTTYVKQQWVESLLFLWTAIEQLINIIWEEKILKATTLDKDVITNRNKFLSDYRTWTTSTKIELLYQKELISIEIYQLLNIARKSRNDFIHTGKLIGEEQTVAALKSFFMITSSIVSNFQNPNELNSSLNLVLQHRRDELYPSKSSISNDKVSHWLALPPLPGDMNWGRKKYEIVEELVLSPLKS